MNINILDNKNDYKGFPSHTVNTNILENGSVALTCAHKKQVIVSYSYPSVTPTEAEVQSYRCPNILNNLIVQGELLR